MRVPSALKTKVKTFLCLGLEPGRKLALPLGLPFDIFETHESQLGICEMVGRPGTHPVKKLIGFTEEMVEAVDSWRAKQRPIPNLSEAIRRLVEIGLKGKK